jgi:GTPase SAR1 family protein
MGILDKIASVLGPGPKTFNILVVGLDNSGKSALIASLKADGAKNSGDILPTVGVKVLEITLLSLCS